ncbi:MAG TPA: hypothetical protein VFK94_03635, partial [Patescibacteria group bacterium]|nr:hypothetical protein [Patescibacteria group bacterium]
LVCAMENDVEGGVPGIRYMDPNFNTYTGRIDPDRGYKFMPDWALQRSFRHRHPDGRIVPGFAIVVTSPKPLPKTSSPLPKLPLYVADGDPTPMRMRSLVNSDTGAVKLLKLKPGKPYRGGYLVTSPVKKNANSVTGDLIAAVSYIDKDDLPTSERIFGDVFVVPTYQTNGDHFMYVKSVDTVAR